MAMLLGLVLTTVAVAVPRPQPARPLVAAAFRETAARSNVRSVAGESRKGPSNRPAADGYSSQQRSSSEEPVTVRMVAVSDARPADGPPAPPQVRLAPIVELPDDGPDRKQARDAAPSERGLMMRLTFEVQQY
jgi:hypothetical protein